MKRYEETSEGGEEVAQEKRVLRGGRRAVELLYNKVSAPRRLLVPGAARIVPASASASIASAF